MKRIMLMALMAMLALALYAPAAHGGGVAAPAQYDDDLDDDGYDDDDGAPLPATGGPALLPLAGAALLVGAGTVGIGMAAKRRFGR